MHGLWLNSAGLTRRGPLRGDTEAVAAIAGTGCTSLAGLRGKIVTAAVS
jgi:hypothetical protein